MFGRHKHEWVKTGERFNPPARTLARVKNIDEAYLERLLYGFTVVTFHCKEDWCPEIRFEQVTGRTVDATTPEGRAV